MFNTNGPYYTLKYGKNAHKLHPLRAYLEATIIKLRPMRPGKSARDRARVRREDAK